MQFFSKLLLILSLSMFLLSSAFADETLKEYIGRTNKTEQPKFSDYPVKPMKFVPAAKPDLNSHKDGKAYRTVITEGFADPVNCAGKYVTAVNGCGTGCQVYWIINKETGKIIENIGTSFGLECRADSSLVIVNPYNEFEDTLVSELPIEWGKTSFFDLKNDKLKLIKEIAYIPLPADAADIVDRIESCDHWSGEPDFNAERGAQIDQALNNDKCDQTGCDYKKILKKYANRPELANEIKTLVETRVGDDESFTACKTK